MDTLTITGIKLRVVPDEDGPFIEPPAAEDQPIACEDCGNPFAIAEPLTRPAHFIQGASLHALRTEPGAACDFCGHIYTFDDAKPTPPPFVPPKLPPLDLRFLALAKDWLSDHDIPANVQREHVSHLARAIQNAAEQWLDEDFPQRVHDADEAARDAHIDRLIDEARGK